MSAATQQSQPPQQQQESEPLDEGRSAGQDRPMPDEDGPHDVPDEMVIEKTLPTIQVDVGQGPK